jgi:endonuclease YncB( thermonuclease family)
MTPTRTLFLAGLLALVALAPVSAAAQAQVGPAYVTRVVDAVTIYADVAGRIETVRYLGVRVPRIEDPRLGNEPYAIVSREGNRRLVEGKWIWLMFDGAPRDAQGRLRAWVWKDGLFVNGALVRDGWAVPAVTEPRLVEYFGALEANARSDRRGLWRSPNSIAYFRPRPITDAVDTDVGGPDSADTRVFSAPAPFAPVIMPPSGGRSSAPSGSGGGVSAPATSSSGMPYTPPSSRSIGTTGRTVK